MPFCARVSTQTSRGTDCGDRLARKQLAQFIGPIAKVVIRRLAPQCSDMDQLYREAAKEIASDGDRQKFLLLRSTGRHLR